MPHRKSPIAKERSRMWAEAFIDREKAETVAQGADYPHLGIARGEVLTAPGYVNPSLLR